MPRIRSRLKRTSNLIKLTDQDVGTKIKPNIFGLPSRDQTWNAHLDTFLRANKVILDTLEISVNLNPGWNEIEAILKPNGIIGAIPLRAPNTFKVCGGIVVRPRFGWNDIGTLLSHIGWSASPQLLKFPLVPGSAKEVPPWILAGPIINRFKKLLKEITRGFRIHEEMRQTPRGQILWKEYCTKQMIHGMFHQLPCRFPELGPDLLLRAYIRWGLTNIQISLIKIAQMDVIARRFVEEIEELLLTLKEVPVKIPDHRTLDHLLRGTGIPSDVLKAGLEALGWLVDERGLAGVYETDGLSWKLTMHELFERWVECLVRQWIHGFGGQISTARQRNTLFPIQWDKPAKGSLKQLAPDIVVKSGDTVYIIDAKYKGHFEELDDTRWREMAEELKAEHRHDFHQILAYASLFDSPRIVCQLIYPMFPGTWRSLHEKKSVISKALLPSGNRQVEIVLMGVPIQLQTDIKINDIVNDWDILRNDRLN